MPSVLDNINLSCSNHALGVHSHDVSSLTGLLTDANLIYLPQYRWGKDKQDTE